VLGLGTEKLFSHFHEEEVREEKASVSVQPTAGGLGLSVSWHF
jgi:hypothetical protein